MDKICIEKIQLSEFDEVAALLTDAFITNPAYSIIFKKKEQVEEGLLWLFKTNLLMHNQKEVLTRVVKEKATGKIIGTFTLIPPEGVNTSFSIYTKIGLPGFLSTFGIDPLLRMMKLDRYNKKILNDSIQVSRYYYLSMVVIRKEYRGTGVGTQVLRYTIQELICSAPASRWMGLTTQLPENVVFYSRLGFEKLDERMVEFKGDTYYNYNMRLHLISNLPTVKR